MSGKKEEYSMKTIKYELKLIFKTKIAIGAGNRQEIEKILREMITSGKLLDVRKEEFYGVVVEEQGERNCPGNCDHCQYLCPKDEDCLMDDLDDSCEKCEYCCKKCGGCTLRNGGTCGEKECKACHWRCPECGDCTHPEGEKLS